MDERLAITRRVMKAMRHESGRRPLVKCDRDGSRQVVICLADDTVDYATQRVAAVGGAATVVVPYGAQLVSLCWVLQVAHQAELIDQSLVHPSSTLEMLVSYLDVSDTERMSFQVSTGFGDVDVTEGERITVPA